jgi:DNA-directed RNA polymerase specialized sigma24 family protein
MEKRFTDADDSELFRQFRAGDAEAFTELYLRHRTPLFSYLRLHALGADAEALYRATWIKLIDTRDDEELGPGGVVERLFRIAHAQVVEASGQGATPPWDAVEQREIAAAEDRLRDITVRSRGRALRVRRALGQLPEAQRESFLLYTTGGLPLPSVASVEGEEVHVAVRRMQMALRSLRAGIEPKFVEKV